MRDLEVELRINLGVRRDLPQVIPRDLKMDDSSPRRKPAEI